MTNVQVSGRSPHRQALVIVGCRGWFVGRKLVASSTRSFNHDDAEAHPSTLIARVSGRRERAGLTVHGRPSPVLLATEDLKSLEGTIEIRADTEDQ
ncbi:hypothetical protein ACI8AK_05300 [Geodermatophilus sp. SYSU D00867]